MSTTGQPAVEVPGDTKSLKKHIFEIGAEVVQNFDPVKKINMHLCGFAFYKDEPSRQVELHHYVSKINEDVAQAIVYDGDGADAKMIGIEYVISEKVFNTLPPEEQKYWHSHVYDVMSASFIAPRIPNTVENSLMTDLIKTYGKTWVLWQTDRGDSLPIGEPKLMMVATKDGQWNPELFKRRDARLGHSSEKIRKDRAVLPKATPNPNADWPKERK